MDSILKSNTKSKMSKLIISAIVIISLVLILFSIWLLYKKLAKKFKGKISTNNNEAKTSNFLEKKFLLLNFQQKTNNYSLNFQDSFVQNNSTISYNNQIGNDIKEIDRSQIYFIKLIGNGFSSKVHLAKLISNNKFGFISREVAVKTINNTNFKTEDVMREIELISKCNHKNIVEYVGHYSDCGTINIVTEYMAGGDLHFALINKNFRPTVNDAFLYILQICEGMEYLAKHHIIHRDLAARNCMMDKKKVVVKITDFGLCRTANVDYEYVSENNVQQLPFRWTAIECYNSFKKFSEKSDVWSFGVVMWEIFARNIQPYEGLNSSGVRDYLKRGDRLSFESISACPKELYEQVMMQCWKELPQDRPTFTQIRSIIEHIYWSFESNLPEYLKSEYETPISIRVPPEQKN